MMHHFQHVQFKSSDDFLEYIPACERSIINSLRQMVVDHIPDGQEKLAYTPPFYYRIVRVCFIWPGIHPLG
jgi:hypothetical protein